MSVKEKLPDVSGKYWTVVEGCVDVIDFHASIKSFVLEPFICDAVTHWMEMNKPGLPNA